MHAYYIHTMPYDKSYGRPSSSCSAALILPPSGFETVYHECNFDVPFPTVFHSICIVHYNVTQNNRPKYTHFKEEEEEEK